MPDEPRRTLLASFIHILSLAWEAKYQQTSPLPEDELIEFLKLSRRQYFDQKADRTKPTASPTHFNGGDKAGFSNVSKALIEAKCKEYGWHIIELAIQADHVHLFVEVFPTVPASEVVKQCKGVTSHELREKYPFLKKLPSLWIRSYFAAAAGNVSAETIKWYIEMQKGL